MAKEHPTCTRDFTVKSRGTLIPLAMSGTELLQSLDYRLHETSRSWELNSREAYQTIRRICGEGRLSHDIFLKEKHWMRKQKAAAKATAAVVETKEEDNYELILDNFYDVFNEVVFGGALPRQICSWVFVKKDNPRWDETMLRHGGVHGIAGDHRERPYLGDIARERISTIEIFELPRGEATDSEHIRTYLGTMLHELLHCFVFNYTCCCETCEVLLDCPDGVTGHALNWALMAVCIREFVETVLNIDVDIGLYTGVALEMIATNATLEKWPLDILGMSKYALQQEINALRSHQASLNVFSDMGKVSLEHSGGANKLIQALNDGENVVLGLGDDKLTTPQE